MTNALRLAAAFSCLLLATHPASVAAQIKGSQLPAASSVADADQTFLIQGGVTKNVTMNLVRGGLQPTLTLPLAVAQGGTGASVASGASLDSITGFSSTGFLSRSGAGTYTFTASTGTGSVVLGTSPLLSGQGTIQGLTTTQPGWYAQVTGDAFARLRIGLNSTDVASIALGTGAAARDTFIERAGSATIRLGGPAAASPLVQGLTVQNVAAGTSNTAGANFGIAGSQGTGTGCGGSIILLTAPAGSSGSAQNALAAALTVDCTKTATFTGPIVSTLATGTAPLAVASTTVVANLNVSQLLGSTWAVPGAIGSTTPSTGSFTGLAASGTVTAGSAIKRDGNFYMEMSGSNPFLNFDTGSFLLYDRSGLAYNFAIGGTVVATLSSTTILPGIDNHTALGGPSTRFSSVYGVTGIFSGALTVSPVAVASLPACTSGMDGARAFVNNATATTFASAVAGSGSNHVPVYCDGSGTPTWKIGQNANDNFDPAIELQAFG